MTGRAPLGRWSRAARLRLVEAAERVGSAFLLEGRKAVMDALERPGVAVREVWAADDLEPETLDALARACDARHAAFGTAPPRDLARASDTVAPQGVLARADDLARDAASVVAQAPRGGGLLLLLDGLQDPGNVGAVMRVAAALGAAGVLAAEGTADPLGPKALRASAGAALAVPFARGRTADLLAAAAAAGFEAWLLDAAGASLWGAQARPPALLLAVGSEGRGARPEVARAAARRIAIPIAPGVESLNAAVSVGIAVAHLARLPRAAPEAAGGTGARP